MTPASRSGEFELKRQIHGAGAYAHVRVEVRPSGQGSDRVQWSVDPASRTSVQPAHWPEEVRATLDGAAAALADLDRIGIDTSGWTVHIVFLGVTEVDTEPTAVRAAAAAATVAAFGAADRFVLTYPDGWRYRPVDAD
jgi:hypothetical protein